MIHYSANLEDKLSPVLKGVEWKEWKTKYAVVDPEKVPGVIQVAALAVSRHLSGCYERGILESSTRQVRIAVPECTPLKPTTLSLAIDRAVELNPSWIRMGGRLVHAHSALFPKELTHNVSV